MTKKILALALAGTTAFSVFASAMSVNAAAGYDAFRPYTPYQLKAADPASTFNRGGATIKEFTGLFNFDGADQTIENTGTVIYAFDYQRISGDTDDVKLKAFKAEVAKGAEATDSDLYTKFTAAYSSTPDVTSKVMSPETNTQSGTATTARANAIYDLGKIYKDSVQKYFTTSGGDKEARVDADELAAEYDSADVVGYDVAALFNAIGDTVAKGDAAYTSEALYLIQEYNRIMKDIGAADTTEVIDRYWELYNDLQDRIEDDYDDDNWKAFTRAIEDAEDLADDAAEANTVAAWNKALAKLQAAAAVEPKAGKYADLQNALVALYDDITVSKLRTVENYPADARDTDAVPLYLKADYRETNMYGNKNAVTAAYADAFINTSDSTDRDSAYSKAWDVWNDARKYGAKIAQSKIDSVLADLEAAIEALDPTSSAPNYQMVLLETAVENVSNYQESDYNANSRKYKEFAAALEKAEEVLAKSNPAASEVENAFKTLATKASALESVTKAVPSATQKTLRDAINSATVSLKEMSSKQGAQYVALQEALAIATDVRGGLSSKTYWAADDIKYESVPYEFKQKSTISDFETAIANLEAAMKGFSQVQGWYEEAGAWKYGEGDGVLNNGWNKIGNFWFFFNEDGTAKQNIWMNEGGKWYYFGNSCVAYSGWGMVDGSWYYFGKDCVMATGWIRPSHSYYYMDPASGKMVTGWAQIGGKWYYFSQASNNLGAMLTSTTTPDGYQVGADGAMI